MEDALTCSKCGDNTHTATYCERESISGEMWHVRDIDTGKLFMITPEGKLEPVLLNDM